MESVRLEPFAHLSSLSVNCTDECLKQLKRNSVIICNSFKDMQRGCPRPAVNQKAQPSTLTRYFMTSGFCVDLGPTFGVD